MLTPSAHTACMNPAHFLIARCLRRYMLTPVSHPILAVQLPASQIKPVFALTGSRCVFDAKCLEYAYDLGRQPHALDGMQGSAL